MFGLKSMQNLFLLHTISLAGGEMFLNVLKCPILAELQNPLVFYTSTKLWRGYIFTSVCVSVCVCLSVCLSVCMSVCLSVSTLAGEPFNQF